MIGPLFTMNLSNFARAAIGDAQKDLLPDDSVEITARPHENGRDAVILVTGSEGYKREIVIREDTVAACIQNDDSRVAAQELVNQLATEIKVAVDAALG